MYPTEVMAAVVLQWWTQVVEAAAVEKANRCLPASTFVSLKLVHCGTHLQVDKLASYATKPIKDEQ